MDKDNLGYINPQQLKDGLDSIGSNLTHQEFTLLLKTADTNKDGRVDVKEFDSTIHKAVHVTEKEAVATRQNKLNAHHR